MNSEETRFRNFFLIFLLAIAWTASASGQDFDYSAKRRHLLPLIIDGGGWQSAILVTNVADTPGQCALELDGRDMNVRRFEQNEGLVTDRTRATFELAAAGGNLIWSSKGARSLTYGYAVLECAEPAVARVLFSISADEELVSMATMTSADYTDEFQFAVMPRIGRHMLALANNNTSDAFCRLSLESADGANAGKASFSVPVLSTVARFLDEVVELPESFSQGTATVSCNRQVAAVGLPFSGAAVTVMSPVSLPKPIISISGGPAVTEGDVASFTIMANFSLAEDLTLSLAVSESSSHVGRADLGEKQVVLQAGQTLLEYTVATIDDSNDDANGTVRVEINLARGYQVSETDDSAQVTVNDNDEPAVVVTPPPGGQPPTTQPPTTQPPDTQFPDLPSDLGICRVGLRLNSALVGCIHEKPFWTFGIEEHSTNPGVWIGTYSGAVSAGSSPGTARLEVNGFVATRAADSETWTIIRFPD